MTNQENRALGPSQDHYRLFTCTGCRNTHTHTPLANMLHTCNLTHLDTKGEGKRKERDGLNP